MSMRKQELRCPNRASSGGQCIRSANHADRCHAFDWNTDESIRWLPTEMDDVVPEERKALKGPLT